MPLIVGNATEGDLVSMEVNTSAATQLTPGHYALCADGKWSGLRIFAAGA